MAMKNKMLTQVLSVLSASIPDAEPDNPVSVWLTEEFERTFPDSEEVGLLRRIAVDSANNDPNGVLELLVGLHNRIGAFVSELTAAQEREDGTGEPSPEEDEDVLTEPEDVLELP